MEPLLIQNIKIERHFKACCVTGKTFHSVQSHELKTSTRTLFFFYKNIFYNNIEAEICEIFKNILRIKPESEILKRV